MWFDPYNRETEERERLKLRRHRARVRRHDVVSDARADCASFIHQHVIIDDTQAATDADTAGTMPFHLWPAQRDLLASLLTERLLLILKARQLGISWLVMAYALWRCLFRSNQLILVFSQGQDEANELLRRASVMYARLAPDVRTALPALIKPNTALLEWANGSRILSLPATRKAGSSYTASLVVLDEFAKAQFAADLYTAVKPTIDAGGQMIILSSAQGTGNPFYERCQAALAGTSRFAFRFLPWTARPDRDAAWYAATEADAISAAHMRQEYPATPEDAFSATDVERFLESITLWDRCRDDALPPLRRVESAVLAADAGVSNDSFGLVLVTRHPDPSRRDDLAVRYARAWYPPKGGTIDFEEVEAEIRRLCREYSIAQISYDQYQLHSMMQRLNNAGIVYCEAFSQQEKRLLADKHLLDLIRARRIAHDGDDDLRAHLDNANRKIEGDEKLRIVKRKGELKIDLAVALSMAAYTATAMNL